MDIDALYNMARAAAQGADRALASQPIPEYNWMAYGGYPVYINEYNRLVPLVIQACGQEAALLFQPIDIGKYMNPADTVGALWKTYLELASARLNSLAAYLQKWTTAPARGFDSLIDIIELNLRPSIYKQPETERDVQNILETIFRSRNLDFRREIISIEYSSKRFVPDFTFDSLDLALEVKLCKSSDEEKRLVDEINADIPAYQKRYRRVLFVVFDLGVIRDEARFKAGIESNTDVHVLVIKM